MVWRRYLYPAMLIVVYVKFFHETSVVDYAAEDCGNKHLRESFVAGALTRAHARNACRATGRSVGVSSCEVVPIATVDIHSLFLFQNCIK